MSRSGEMPSVRAPGACPEQPILMVLIYHPRCDLCARGEPEFGEYMFDVTLRCSGRDNQTSRDRPVGQPFSDQRGDFALSFGQLRRGTGSCHGRRAGDASSRAYEAAPAKSRDLPS